MKENKKKSKKNIKLIKLGKGFTLIEMLLVIAIIGILASVVFAMIGNSDNTKRKATMSTAKSIMPYVQECMFKGDALNAPDNTKGLDDGDKICDNSDSEWPTLSVDGCVYGTVADYNYSANCSVGDVGNIICSGQDGKCVENY